MAAGVRCPLASKGIHGWVVSTKGTLRSLRVEFLVSTLRSVVPEAERFLTSSIAVVGTCHIIGSGCPLLGSGCCNYRVGYRSSRMHDAYTRMKPEAGPLKEDRSLCFRFYACFPECTSRSRLSVSTNRGP